MDLASSPSYPVVVPRHPLYAMLVPFPAVCFTLTLLTDIAFWQTSNLMWQNFSAWLLLVGLVFGGLALVAGVADFLFRSRRRGRRLVWAAVVGSLVVLGLAFVNSLVHAGDGWTAVVPYGLILSAATVVLVALTAWLGRPKVSAYDRSARS